MPHRPRRTFRFLGYLLISICGIAAILWHPAPVSHAATGALFYLWVAFLILGGLLCAAGAATDMWLGEYVGLWPIITSSFIFGVSALATGHLASVAGGMFLLAVTSWLAARWQEVAVLRREADRQVRSEQ